MLSYYDINFLIINILDSSSSTDSALEVKKDRKAEREQSFVRGDEKRKPTHRRTPSGSTTPRKESKERATPPKERKNIQNVSKPDCSLSAFLSFLTSRALSVEELESKILMIRKLIS
jgi:hypothetical protein